MKPENLSNHLIELGLTDYESKGYLAMLRRHVATASELARLSGIPRTRIYEVLDRLIQKGLCLEILDQVKKYKAIEPDIALNRLIEQQRAAIILKENLASSISPFLQQRYIEHSSNQDPLDYIELWRNPSQVAQRFLKLVDDAQREILVLVKPPYSNPKKKLEEQTFKSVEAAERKLACRAIYEISTEPQERKWEAEQIKIAVEAGEQARIIEKLPLKMAIFDGTKVIFAMEDYHPTLSRQTSLVIEHHALAQCLKILFETLWSNSRDWHELLD